MKARKRHRRSKDKRGAQKLTPKRAALARERAAVDREIEMMKAEFETSDLYQQI